VDSSEKKQFDKIQWALEHLIGVIAMSAAKRPARGPGAVYGERRLVRRTPYPPSHQAPAARVSAAGWW